MKIRFDASSFWRHVDIGRRSECWNWTGAVNTTGYGAASWSGRMYVAHRIVAWLTGMVSSPAAPDNSKSPFHVLHKCDNRRCCNPRHLFIGSYSDNLLDAYAKGRRKITGKSGNCGQSVEMRVGQSNRKPLKMAER